MKTEPPELFDPSTVAVDSPRLKLIKKHDIQTHFCPHVPNDDSWWAIPMKAAREKFKGHTGPEDDLSSIAGITASVGVLLDDYGMIFRGETKEDVIDQALQWISQNQN